MLLDQKPLNYQVPGLTDVIKQLKRLVKKLHDLGIRSRPAYSQWAKSHEGRTLMNEIFGYDGLPENSRPPQIGSLVSPHFHPNLPLVGLNYTPLAHFTLFAVPGGWTLPLRLCRGITFDLETQELIAFAFPKFFNFGENKENGDLPDKFLEASLKYDGHLGIIYFYRGQALIKTRGSFTSPSAKIAQAMLDQMVAENAGWQEMITNESSGSQWTILVEIIHPETQVIVDYAGEEKMILLGAYWFRSPIGLFELKTGQLMSVSSDSGLLLPDYWKGSWKTTALLAEIERRDVANREGWVARYADGRLVKFKYKTYIGEMVRRKLTYKYLMQRAVAGKLETMVMTLDEEILSIAYGMLGRISLIMWAPGSARDKWRRLYELVTEEERTESFKLACREFAKKFTKTQSEEDE